ARHRDDACREVLRETDRPFALVVPCPGGSLSRDKLDVPQDDVAIDRLSHVEACLAVYADRAVIEEVPEEPREGERPLPGLGGVQLEREGTHTKLVSVFVVRWRIEWALESHDHAVLAGLERIGPNPSAVGAEDLVIGRAGDRATVLQGERDDVAHALFDERCLTRDRDPAIRRRA